MYFGFGDHLAKLLVIEGEHAGVFAIELHLLIILMVTIMLLVMKMLMGMITTMIWMSHLHHRERICSCEITLGQKSVKEIKNLIYNWSSPFFFIIIMIMIMVSHDNHHHHDHDHPHLGVPIRL